MRFSLPALLAALGLLAAFAALPFALAADAPAAPIVRRAYVPALAGDSASGFGLPATATPTLPVSATPTLGACAADRSAIRTLSDAAAAFSRIPVLVSIFELVDLPRPAITGSTPRIAPAESRVVQLNAWLRGFTRKSNGAIELLISPAPGGPIMVAAFPPPGCLAGASPADQDAMAAARSALSNRCGVAPVGTIAELAGPISISGVPFWGATHTDGQTGAPNGIELGPVLSFEKKDALDCQPSSYSGQTPTPTPTVILGSMSINISPTSAPRGATVVATIHTQPATPGIACSIIAWDNEMHLMHESADKPTGAGGTATFSFTIPAGAATGSDARVTPRCSGFPTIGSARLTITP